MTTQVFPPSSDAYDESLDSRYSYDPAKAKALLAEAGYASGLTLKLPSSTLLGDTILALITQQLKDVGITVGIHRRGNNFIADLLAPKYGVELHDPGTAVRLAADQHEAHSRRPVEPVQLRGPQGG